MKTFVRKLESLAVKHANLKIDYVENGGINHTLLGQQFWPGFQADVDGIRRECGMESPQWDCYVAAVIQAGAYVPAEINRPHTREELREIAEVKGKVDENWRELQTRRLADYCRLMG